jgi:hypothetical protein
MCVGRQRAQWKTILDVMGAEVWKTDISASGWLRLIFGGHLRTDVKGGHARVDTIAVGH